MAEISDKNTKNEILKAYNDMIKKIKEEKPADRKAEKKQEEEKVVFSRANNMSAEEIVNRLASVKIDIAKQLEDIENKLTSEYKRFSELMKAVEIAERNLEQIHEISVNADSLNALVRAHKEEKTRFEAEMEMSQEELDKETEQKRAEWKKEQENMDLAMKERKARLEKERKQEDEDYQYALNKKRKLDEEV